jgi:hypothetical protein
MMNPIRGAFLALILGFATAGLAACDEPDGPAERAGESVDNAAQRAGRAIENAGEKVQRQAQ